MKPKNRKKITEELKFDIPKDIGHGYKPPITIGDIIGCKEIVIDDVLLEYYYEERERKGWGLSSESDPRYYQQPVVVVERTRWETDEEFDERIQRAGKIEKEKREKEYHEYLRLKGIYEN